MFTSDELEQLLAHRTISGINPWCSNDQASVDRHLRTLCDEIMRTTNTIARIDSDDYGSGYASFVDAWFYRPTADFAPSTPAPHGENHIGLVVLLSRLAPYFVLMQGEKWWSEKGASSYLPSADGVDWIEAKGPLQLAHEVQLILERHGLARLSSADLSKQLPEGTRVPTILCEAPFTEFDALFHWED